MSHVDNELAGLLRTIDLPTLGTRIRNARLAKGLTQSQAAGDGRVDGVHLPDRGRAPPPRRAAAGADRGADSTPPSSSSCTGVDPHQKAEVTLKPGLRRARARVGRGGRGADPRCRGAGADRERRAPRAALAGTAPARPAPSRPPESWTKRSWRWRTWSPRAPAGGLARRRDRAEPLLPRDGRPRPGHRDGRARTADGSRSTSSTGPTRRCSWPSRSPPPTSSAVTSRTPSASATGPSSRPSGSTRRRPGPRRTGTRA